MIAPEAASLAGAGVPYSPTVSPRIAYVLAVGLLAAVNVGGSRLPGWTYVPLNVILGTVLLVIARKGGATAADLGLRREDMARSLKAGALLAGLIVAAIAVAAAVPMTRSLFDDERAAGIGVAGLLYQTLLRIPVGTALFEEIAFRGGLVGLGRSMWSRHGATAVAAVLFGLWHIVPSRTFAGANAPAEQAPTALVVAAAVLATAAVGWLLTALRDRTGHLAAPVVVHTAANAAAFTAAWAVLG